MVKKPIGLSVLRTGVALANARVVISVKPDNNNLGQPGWDNLENF